ncbi:MAG: 3'(2'),5'-bisphosphate nucleotidase CysQ [Flavobacteriales bacterium]
MKFSDSLYQAVYAAWLAGKEIMEVYSGEFNVEHKDDNSPLTLADKKAHTAIKNALQQSNIELLSEEGAHADFEIRKGWKKLWVVDPLDGTKEFIKRNGEFTVNIALVENGFPVLGVIYAPELQQMYWAEKGLGVYSCPLGSRGTSSLPDIKEMIDSCERINQQHVLPDVFTIVASRSHMSVETETFINEKKKTYGELNFISSGSALKFCLVASGKAHCYPRFAPTMEWDTAAGQIMVEEAGRTLIDYDTKQRMRYNRENLRNNWFLVE